MRDPSIPPPASDTLADRIGAVEVPPAKTPLRDVIAAWWHPVDDEPTDEQRQGAQAMADEVLAEIVRIARGVN